MILHWTSHLDGITYQCEGALDIQHEIPLPQADELWFGMMSFDDKCIPGDPWQQFPTTLFFRPAKVTLIPYSHSGFTPPILQDEVLEPPEAIWQETMQELLGSIAAGDLIKVVQARRASYPFTAPALEFAEHIFASQKKGVSFYFQRENGASFISATPELLYRRVGSSLTTEAIAGTIAHDQEDILLLESAKDCHEHALVTAYIVKNLSTLCTDIQVGPLHVIHAQKVKHLRQEITATLPLGINDRDLIALFHPTPAVSGLPCAQAAAWIKKNEPFQRGYYAAPLCKLTKDHAEVAVGIRSALVANGTLHLFAGSGVVQGSSIEKEREELKTKWRLYHAASR